MIQNVKFQTTLVFKGWAKTDGKTGDQPNIQFAIAQKNQQADSHHCQHN
jgi:hypothetical protein